MQFKRLSVSAESVGALQTAIRIRIIYLQSYRQQCEQTNHHEAAKSLMDDIANLTKLGDDLAENPMEQMP